MKNTDWDAAPADWQQGKRQEPTFKQDLGGFVFHISMVALIGASVVGAWQILNPQLVIHVTTEQIQH